MKLNLITVAAVVGLFSTMTWAGAHSMNTVKITPLDG